MYSTRFEDLLEQCDHPYLRVVPQMDFIEGWTGEPDSIAAHFRTDSGQPWFLALGAGAGHLASAAAPFIARPSRWTLPRADEHLLGPERSRWDWWIIDSDPLVEYEAVIDLGLEHDAQIARFLAEASPTASSKPGDPEVLTWHGIREGADLVAVGAALRWKSGAPVLASIATHPQHRGRGLARSVTSSLTAWFRARGQTRVSLGMYASNDSARRTYTAVGYRVAQAFTSATMA